MTIRCIVIFIVIFGVVWTSPQLNHEMGSASPTIWGNGQDSDYDTNAYEADYFINHDHASENNAEMMDGTLQAFSQNPGV